MAEELILEYIEGRLGEQEQIAFEKRLEEDTTFKAAYLQELARHSAWKAMDRVAQKTELKALLQQSSSKTRPLFSAKWIGSIAAGFIMLFIAAWFFFPQNKTPQSLAMAYFEAYPMSNIRGEDDGSFGQQQQALSLYQAQAYDEAIPLFKQLVQQRPNDTPIRLNYASALMASQQPKLAISLLKTINTDDPSADAVQWYLALAYLQAGNQQAAIPILQQIGAQNHYKKQSAQEILSELE